MNINTSSNQPSTASRYFRETSVAESEAEGEFAVESSTKEETNTGAAMQMALAMAGNPTPAAPVNLKGQMGAAGTTPSAEALAGKPLASVNLAQASKEATPRDKLVNAVQLQERQSASTNTVDALTGLQPWDRNWVFKRGDIALSPQAMQAEADQAEGIAQLVQKLQSSQELKRGGEPVTASAIPNPNLPGAKPEESASVAKAVAAETTNLAPVFSNGAEAMASPPGLSEMAALNSSVAGGMVEQPGRERRNAEKLGVKVNGAKPGIQSLSSEEFLGLKDSVAAKPVPMAAVPSVSGRPQGGIESPVGTWKPRKEAGKNGLLPGQEDAFRTALDQTQLSAARNLNTTLNSSNVSGLNPRPRDVEGWVTQGSMAQNRLSTETLVGIGAQMRSMTQFGGGEMRIRLRPENLGELSVRVNTNGNQVSLEIRASDEKAKRIIEDSVGYLKESLASQNLTVSRLDLSVGPVNSQGNPNFDLSQQSAQSGLNLGQDQGQQSMQGQLGRQDSERSDSSEVGLSRADSRARPTSRSGGSGPAASSGRLDVMA